MIDTTTPEARAAYRKRVMIEGITYMIAANCALDNNDLEKIIVDLQLLLHSRQNIPF